MSGTRTVAVGTGSTLRQLVLALRAAEMPEEPVLDKIARGARWEWRTELELTGEPLTRADFDRIVICTAEAK